MEAHQTNGSAALDDRGAAEARAWLLYDGDCPFCSAYTRLLRLRKAAGPVDLIDARMRPDLVAEMAGLGYDIDKGMLLRLDGHYYLGADCLHRLALLSSPSTTFNRINRVLFRVPGISRTLYPGLRAGRNLMLYLLGRRKMAAAKTLHGE